MTNIILKMAAQAGRGLLGRLRASVLHTTAVEMAKVQAELTDQASRGAIAVTPVSSVCSELRDPTVCAMSVPFSEARASATASRASWAATFLLKKVKLVRLLIRRQPGW